ncbi:MAG: hypothetical protein NTV22_04935 [bacterium]|nr:hypothetical protein [bacterium]
MGTDVQQEYAQQQAGARTGWTPQQIFDDLTKEQPETWAAHIAPQLPAQVAAAAQPAERATWYSPVLAWARAC